MLKVTALLTHRTIVDHRACLWSAWGAWQKCNKGCGGGDQTRFRMLLVGSDGQVAEGGEDEDCDGELSETRECNMHGCDTG